MARDSTALQIKPELATPTLRELQSRFFKQLTSLRPLKDAAYEEWIVAESREQAMARLSIYKEMYAFRLCEVLRHDFEVVEQVVGPEQFQRIAVEYLDAHPSRNPSVRHLGHSFAAFLETHPLADRFPWLWELARLEWARGEMIDAQDRVPVTTEELATLPPEAWPGLRFALVDAHQLLELSYPVHRVWLAARQGQPLAEILTVPLEPRITSLVTWRQGITVSHRCISDEEARLLGWLGEGLTLEEIGHRLQTVAPDQDNGQFLATALRRWIAAGLLRTFKPFDETIEGR